MLPLPPSSSSTGFLCTWNASATDDQVSPGEFAHRKFGREKTPDPSLESSCSLHFPGPLASSGPDPPSTLHTHLMSPLVSSKILEKTKRKLAHEEVNLVFFSSSCAHKCSMMCAPHCSSQARAVAVACLCLSTIQMYVYQFVSDVQSDTKNVYIMLHLKRRSAIRYKNEKDGHQSGRSAIRLDDPWGHAKEKENKDAHLVNC